jgi:hypothetical protein
MTAVSQHVNTGADITPDGRLLVVQRFYSQLRGPSARLLSYALLPTGVPDSASVRQLAGFESAGGIDNMEGLAVSQDAEGRMIVWLLSDDNFNTPQQRTLLLAFHLDD